ncbi:autophagy-related protein 2 [Diospyros lotus]|uniref:autophagy-related protein 2 n=1 Tax=Diospyros lotus TaxID=55363 RepID=UPI0022513D0B|nr:autophagy-related protein 2 [Diospyros lotus]
MFPWNIAKSAEAMFSRWAIKRACKFLLKKKLGQFILGDIDLNQLDVQLRAGTIQLSDLALNVEYINQKFCPAASVAVKEGSIGSLSVIMPWKGKGCEIEVDELELVLAPAGGLNYQFESESGLPRKEGNYGVNHEPSKVEHENLENSSISAFTGIHEGVKTIAKMVKWLLTSFHVNIKKLIVAFDSSLVENEKNAGSYKTLVLRISEVECGTRIFEEVISNTDDKVDDFLGLNQLTNFVKFQGAILEFLQMEGVDNEAILPCAPGTNFGEWYTACCPSNARTPVVTGERGGFSGTLKLSIPWRNGTLDICKVDADAYIDPLELRLQPSSIKWFLYLWEIIKGSGKSASDHANCNVTGSVSFNSSSHCYPSTSDSFVTSSDNSIPCNENSFSNISLPLGKETAIAALLPESQLISDWVPFSNQRDSTEGEPDFGASIEQFFECFDSLRNSQSALGSSGMWNWTSSVFGAITAASNLASGSLHIPSEQQHVETNLKVTLAGISILYSLFDGDLQHSCGPKGDKTNVGSNVHYLGIKVQDMLLVLQVCPQETNFNATVECIELVDHFNHGYDNPEFGFHACNDIEKEMHLIQQKQAAVHDALPPFCSSNKHPKSDKQNGCQAADFSCPVSCTDRGISKTNCKGIYSDDVVKVTLLRTSGAMQCQFTMNSRSSDDNFMRLTSFSLKLPPFVCWVDFHLINMIMVLLEEVGKSSEMDGLRDGSSSEGSKICTLSQRETKRNSHSNLATVSPEETLRGNIFLPTARVIFCFPFNVDRDFRTYSLWDQFIVLDFCSQATLGEGSVQTTIPFPNASSQKRYSSSKTSRSFHLNIGDLGVYLINSSSNSNSGSDMGGVERQTFLAENIFSATNRSGHLSVISMLWLRSLTDSGIANKAKLLATSEDSWARNWSGKGYEFASVTTAKATEDLGNLARQEMILSSAFSMHASLPPVKINLSSSQYKGLHHLLQQAINGISCVLHDPANAKTDIVSQMSIFVECDSAEICLCLENVETVKGPIQNELPGSWHHLKLEVKKFQLLSVSNIGGICGANFLWVAHGEGNLWGSVTGIPSKEFLLISCSNSTMGRGDGEASNVLSSKFAGSDIIHLWDPETGQSCMSITVRCGTIIATGGRLDWFGTISSFFSVSSPDIEQASEKNLDKGNSVESDSSFVLNLVDVGLSYEPYFKGPFTSEVFDFETSSVNVNEVIQGQYFACLLAASSLKVSNKKVGDCNGDYKIRLQDLGLLLHMVPGPENVGGAYSVEHLHKVGYVKVAQEALIQVTLRVNCEDGLLWEFECSDSHISLDTCHDTTYGLIHLAAQLQQLFAPDVEESLVHLQTRWNNVQKAQEREETRFAGGDSAPSTSHSSCLGMKSNIGAINLMDEIYEDAFQMDGQWDDLSDSSGSPFHISVDDNLLEETYDFSATNSDSFSFNDSLPLNVLESSQPSFFQKSFPEFIEGYLTEFSSMSDPSQKKQSSDDIPEQKSSNMGKGDVKRVNSGWYGDGSLNILEDHLSDVSKQPGPQQLVAEEAIANFCRKHDDQGKVRGRVLLKNINVIWRMYAGSDWPNLQKNAIHSPVICGRDRTVYLELVLSGIDFQYEIYPEGDICVSRLSLSVQDFNLNDNSQNAPWKLVLGYYQSKDHPRQSSSKAFKLDLEGVRPNPLIPIEEYRLRTAFLPMLLQLHQNQLDFLISFFGGESLSVNQSPHAPQDLTEPEVFPGKSSNFGGHTICEEALLPYFQMFDMWPVLVRVDYNPRRVDLAALRGGKYVELVNLVPWKGVELQLKHVHAIGVYGWNSVCETIVGEWLEDISQNQIHKLLQGLPPIRSLVAMGSGAAKLVSLPVKSYRKDHRLLKGMQRGTIAFLRSISLEAVGLGVHLAAGAHDILLQAEYSLASIPPSISWPVQSRTSTDVRSNQPKDARQGIKLAYESISDGLGKTASALVQTPFKRYQRGAGAGSALATAVKAAPAAVIAPASAAARAVHCALLGVRNSLDPEHKDESIKKYLGANQPWKKIAEG